MIEHFTSEVAGNAMRAVATVTEAAGLGDAVERLDQPMRRLVVERLAARLADGKEAEIFDREWVAFFGPDKSGGPDRRTQTLQVLQDMAEASRGDLPVRGDPIATLCEAMFAAGKHGPAIGSIVNSTIQLVLKVLKRDGWGHDSQALRLAVADIAVDLFLEMERPDVERLAADMKRTVPKLVKLVMLGEIR
jgi:hypothetical protein